MEPAEQLRLERQFHEHGWSDWSLTPYGYGDGGGGPTREMVGRARRMADLDGLPRLEMGTVDGFFASVEDEVGGGRSRPHLAGRAVLRDAPGHADEPDPDEGREPDLRAPAPRGRAVVGRRRRAVGADRGGGGRARPAVEGRARPAVPRHPPRIVDRLGARRRRGRAHPDRRPAGGADRRRARPTLHPTRWRWPRPGAGRLGRWSSRPRLRPGTARCSACATARSPSWPRSPRTGSSRSRRWTPATWSSSPIAHWPTAIWPWPGTTRARWSPSARWITTGSCSVRAGPSPWSWLRTTPSSTTRGTWRAGRAGWAVRSPSATPSRCSSGDR